MPEPRETKINSTMEELVRFLIEEEGYVPEIAETESTEYTRLIVHPLVTQ